MTSSVRRYGIVAAVLLLSTAFFFRHAWLAGFARGYGDSYDGLIEIAILEHWHNVIAHGAAWNVTDYFWPHSDTLGYNDTNIVPGIPYAAARSMGADPFIAIFAAHAVMKAIGFLGMYALLRRGLRVGWPMALAGATIFATANVSLVQLYHGQLLSVGLTPWLALAAIATVRALLGEDGQALRRAGLGLALLFGLTSLNAFYGAWFFALFAGVFAVVGLALAPRPWRAAFIAGMRRQWRSLIVIGAVGVAAQLPFLAVYLPKLAEGARHSWGQGAYLYLPDLMTLFNVGPGNLVWGPVLRALTPTGGSLPGGEGQVGLPIGLLVTTLLAVSWAAKDRAARWLPLSLALTLGLILAAMMRWPGDVSLWFYFYQLLPGADAVRVVSRFLLFALVPVIMIVMAYLDRTPRPQWATMAILGFLLIEQVQTRPALALDHAPQLVMLAAVGHPPAECDSFFVVTARSPAEDARQEARAIDIAWGGDGRGGPLLLALYRHNVDAMLIASYTHVPTINGFSSFNPPDWRFAIPDGADYLLRVRRYVAAHRLTRVCGLDRRRSPMWFRLAA